MCNRDGKTWAKCVRLDSPVNTLSEEYHPTITNDGTLYFCSMRDNPKSDIYRSRCENGNYSTVEIMDKVINLPFNAWDPFIAPDESYIIFTSIYPDGYGKEDQYISYSINGHWTNPKNLGAAINTVKIEYGSYISTDGKYYFFSRPDGWGPNIQADLYWINTSFINKLKQTNFIPYLNVNIACQSTETAKLFTYTIPDNSFIDDDGNNTLTYSASLCDGSQLPSWLSFNPAARTFSGKPTEVGTIKIKITATDNAKAMVACDFELRVEKQH